MFCKNCGKELPDDSVFCVFCGTKVGTDDAENKIENVDSAQQSIGFAHLTNNQNTPQPSQPISSRTVDASKIVHMSHSKNKYFILGGLLFCALIVIILVFVKRNPKEEESDLVSVETWTSGVTTDTTYYVYDNERKKKYKYEVSESSSSNSYKVTYYIYDEETDKQIASVIQKITEYANYPENNSSSSFMHYCYYDDDMNMIAEEDEGSYYIEYTYEDGHVVLSREYTNNNLYRTTYRTYDEDGNQTEIRYVYNDDSFREAWYLYTYNSKGEKKTSTRYDSIDNYTAVSNYYYDKDGKLIKVDDGLEPEYYEYDSKGNLIKKTMGVYLTTYAYVSDPAETDLNMDMISQVFDIDKIEQVEKSSLANIKARTLP